MKTFFPSKLCVASAAALALCVASTGCQSKGGGSRWAWNPWAKPAPDATALADAPGKLPSDGATPQIETLDGAKPTSTAVASKAPQTPPALAGVAPKFEAVATAAPTAAVAVATPVAPTPKIEKPAPASPNWTPFPTAVAQTTPAMPTATPQTTATTAKSAAGPYDPNGYLPQVAPTASSAFGAFANTTSPAPAGDNPFAAMASSASTGATTVSRATQPVVAATSSTNPAKSWFEDALGSTAATANQAATSVTAQANAAVTKAVPVAMPTATPAYPTTGLAAQLPTGAPAVSGYPVTSTAAAFPAYPTTSIQAAAAPAVKATPDSGSVAGASTIRLTAPAGGYRPGGTSTYGPAVSVATRPAESSGATAPARY